MNITLSREIDPGREIVSMLCGMASERYPNADQRGDGRMRSAAAHYLTAPALKPLRPALDALTELEEHVLAAVSVDDERLRRLFTAPRMETQPGIHLYTGMQRGITPGVCAQDILLAMSDEERTPHVPQEVPLDAFVREATKLGYDRKYVMNLTQMLACWDEDIAWLHALLDKALPRFEEKRTLVEPLVDSWATALEPRLPKMRETGEICGMLRLQSEDWHYVLVPALISFSSLLAFTPEPDGTQPLRYGVLFDPISVAMSDETDNQLIARLRALGDRRRLKIVRALMLRPHNAGEIADLTQLSPATVSYHMTELVNTQLVSAEATGSRVLYRLNSEGLRALMDDLGAMVGKGS